MFVPLNRGCVCHSLHHPGKELKMNGFFPQLYNIFVMYHQANSCYHVCWESFPSVVKGSGDVGENYFNQRRVTEEIPLNKINLRCSMKLEYLPTFTINLSQM